MQSFQFSPFTNFLHRGTQVTLIEEKFALAKIVVTTEARNQPLSQGKDAKIGMRIDPIASNLRLGTTQMLD